MLSSVKPLLLTLALYLAIPSISSAQDCLALSEAHQIFELRQAADARGASDFCVGASELASLQLASGRKHLQKVIHANPTSAESYRAHELLGYAYLRTGMYREFLSEVQQSLKLKPTAADAKQMLPMASALARYPDQQTVHLEPATGKSDGPIAITINGLPASYIFDTGANLSVMSENEAKRFGMKIETTQSTLGDSGGLRVGVRIASAEDLLIGKIHLKHVAFLIFADDQPPFNDSPERERGLIGIPILLAVRSFSYDQDGHYRFAASPQSQPAPNSNMLFDGANPVVRLTSGGKSLAFTLDTGAGNTDLGPVFGKAFPELLARGTKDKQPSVGLGGTVVRESTQLASVPFNLGGKDVILKPAFVLDDIPLNSRLWAAGNLGNDLLNQSKTVTLDFSSMTLTLD
jgi:predicted aspartyl protease